MISLTFIQKTSYESKKEVMVLISDRNKEIKHEIREGYDSLKEALCQLNQTNQALLEFLKSKSTTTNPK